MSFGGASNYPPGHPTGMGHGQVEFKCPECGERHLIAYTYDRAVNAFDLEDAPERCKECGRPVKDDELDDLSEVDDDPFEYDDPRI